ncbi:MAG: hypothetical protein ABFD96_07870 [Armatimonadia bacterium]
MAAPDFYFAINATFRWILERCGEGGLREYWRALGRQHYAHLTERLKGGGLPALRDYWERFYAEEPGGEVSLELAEEALVLTVHTCPAIKHLRAHGREIMPLYCEHCTHVSAAFCEPAGIGVKVVGGGGTCRQVFTRSDRS